MSTSEHPYLRAALLAFIAGLPFSFGDFSIVGYYWGFIILFGLIGCWQLRATPGAMSTLWRAHPAVGWLLPAWMLSMTVSLVNVFLFANPEGFQQFTSVARYLYDLTLLLFTLVVARLLYTRALNLAHVFIALAVGVAAMVVFHIYVYQTNTIDALTWFQTPPLGPHVRDQGNLACAVVAALSVIYLVRHHHKPIVSVSLLAAMLVAWSFLIWTGGRMGVAAALFTVFVSIIWVLSVQIDKASRISKLKRSLALLLILPVALVVADAFTVYEWNGIGRIVAFGEQAEHVSQAAAQSEDVVESQKLNQLTTGRMQMWAMSINAMMEAPLFGLGPYGYFFIPERTYDDQPHNFLVQFLVEWGFVGTVLMLAMILGCVWQVFTQWTKRIRAGDDSYSVGVAVVLALTLHALTGGTYFKIQPITCVALGYAALVAQAMRKA